MRMAATCKQMLQIGASACDMPKIVQKEEEANAHQMELLMW